MRKMDMQAVVWKEGKHYVSQCLNFDIASHGTSEKKALEHLKEAVELSLEDTRRRARNEKTYSTSEVRELLGLSAS